MLMIFLKMPNEQRFLRVQNTGSTFSRVCFRHAINKEIFAVKTIARKIKVVEINALRKFPRNNIALVS